MEKNNLSKREKDDFNKRNGVEIANLEKDLFKIAGEKGTSIEHLSSKPYSYWKSVGKLLLKSPTFMISFIFILGIVIAMIVIPFGKVVDPAESLTGFTSAQAPSWQYPFGLGIDGEDYAIKIWAGVRTTLSFALLITLIQVVIGIFIGSIWGYFKKTDILFIQITNFLSLIPLLVLVLFVIFLFGGKSSYFIVVLAISIQTWITMAATTRIQLMLVKNTDYNTASIFLGSRPYKIITKNIMPRILSVIVQAGTFAIPAAIGLDATLTFLGFGYVDPENRKTTSLGKVLTLVLDGNQYQDYPHLILFPVIMITLISVLFFLLGKVFADSLDPKNHR